MNFHVRLSQNEYTALRILAAKNHSDATTLIRRPAAAYRLFSVDSSNE